MAVSQRRRLRLSLVCTAVVVLAAAGCARPGSTGATTDGHKITIACGATEQWCAAMANTFNQQHPGIRAVYVRLSSGEALARIRAHKDNPEFDVWDGGPADGYAAAAGEGLLEAYTSPNAAKIPAKYKDSAGYWTGIYVGALGFCSNSKVLAEKKLSAPQSWQDLLNPALSKNVSMAHPATSGTAYTALWTAATLHGGDQDAAIAYFKQLNANILQYPKSGTGPIALVERGEVAVGVVFSHDCVAAKEAGFSDLTVSFPAEGTGYEIGGVGVVKGAHNPDSAKTYIDWALTPAAQELGPAAGAYQRPTNPDAKVTDKAFDAAAVKLVDFDVAAAGKAEVALTKRFEAEVVPAPQ